jgi:hypothetical protein
MKASAAAKSASAFERGVRRSSASAIRAKVAASGWALAAGFDLAPDFDFDFGIASISVDRSLAGRLSPRKAQKLEKSGN